MSRSSPAPCLDASEPLPDLELDLEDMVSLITN